MLICQKNNSSLHIILVSKATGTLWKNPSSFLAGWVSSHGFSHFLLLRTTSAALCFYPLCYSYPQATLRVADMLSKNLSIRILGKLESARKWNHWLMFKVCNATIFDPKIWPHVQGKNHHCQLEITLGRKGVEDSLHSIMCSCSLQTRAWTKLAGHD